MKKITTVILAAGKSSRFKHNKSKIFQDLCGLSVIDYVYKIAKYVSNSNVIFVCNKNNILELRKKFSNAKFVLQNKQLGTADAVIKTKKNLKNSNILILFADVPLISISIINKLIRDFKKNNCIGSMIAFNAEKPYGYGRVVNNKSYVGSVVEEINTNNHEKKIKLCNSGVMICDADLLFKNIKKISNKNIKKEKYLPDIFSIFYKINKSFTYVVGLEEEMLGINTIHNLINADRVLQKKIQDRLINGGVIIQEPNNTRVSFDTIVKKGSIIEPFVVIKSGVIIGENVKIKSHSVLESSKIGENSSIGPSARIRPYTIINKNVKVGNYVEIKNSKIGSFTSISHLSYIGDSKIGKYVNIGAGTITCNYDGKKKHISIIQDNVFVGSNSSLVAPIKIGKNSTIGAGSVITKNIPPNHLAIERSDIKIIRKRMKK